VIHFLAAGVRPPLLLEGVELITAIAASNSLSPTNSIEYAHAFVSSSTRRRVGLTTGAGAGAGAVFFGAAFLAGAFFVAAFLGAAFFLVVGFFAVGMRSPMDLLNSITRCGEFWFDTSWACPIGLLSLIHFLPENGQGFGFHHPCFVFCEARVVSSCGQVFWTDAFTWTFNL
jgi:hypothetical protein